MKGLELALEQSFPASDPVSFAVVERVTQSRRGRREKAISRGDAEKKDGDGPDTGLRRYRRAGP